MAPAKPQLGAPQKAAQNRLFPGLEAEGFHRGGQLLLPSSLQSDRPDEGFGPTGLAAVGIDVAGIGHQGRMNKLIDRGTVGLAPRRWWQCIAAEPPARVEGHAEAVHGAPPEQGLKAQLGAHHIHRLRPLQQGSGMAPIGADPQARMGDRGLGQVAALATRRHIGMDLEQHGAVGMVGQGCLKHALKALPIAHAVAQREIAPGLVDHQHKGFAGGEGLAGAVVLAHPFGLPERAQGSGPLGLLGGEGLADQRFQPAGGVGVVIDAQIVDQQRPGRPVGAQAEGAQEAILTAPHRQAPLPGDRLRRLTGGLAAPGQQGGEGGAAAGLGSHHQTGRCQQGPEGGDPGQGPRRDAQHLSGGRACVHDRSSGKSAIVEHSHRFAGPWPSRPHCCAAAT